MAQLLPSARLTLQVGGSVFVNITDLIVMIANAGAGKWGTFRLVNGSAGYQVTSGKTLKIHALQPAAPISADSEGSILYGDTDVGINGAAAPTNPVYLGGDITFKSWVQSNTGAVGGPARNPMFTTPATKYPAVQSNAGTVNMLAYGYEFA